jgi:hypothetical protein
MAVGYVLWVALHQKNLVTWDIKTIRDLLNLGLFPIHGLLLA